MLDRSEMGRGEAAEMFDKLREKLADGWSGPDISAWLEKDYGILPLRECGGVAHKNGRADNCGACAPRWGFTGNKVKFR